MKTFAGIIGIILLLPIALAIVACVVISIIGGYILVLLEFAWLPVLIIVLVILVIKIIGHFI